MRKTLLAILVSGTLSGWVSAQSVFGGRIVAGQERPGILVSLVRENGQILDQTFTNVRGAFRFEDVPLRDLMNDTYVYLVVEEDGFQPHRQRINQLDVRGSGTVTVFLEPEDTRTALGADSGGELTVDLNQLGVEISDEARREYEDALDEAADGDIERAVEHLERATELAPEYYEAWVDLGAQYSQLGRYDDAIAALLEAASVNPAGALAPMNLGALYFQQGDRERAEADPRSDETFLEAQGWLERSIELDSTSAAARYYLGATFFRLSQYELAEGMLQTAVEIAGRHPQARLMLINVYARLNRLPDALAQARAFVDENPEAPERERIMRLVGQIEEALER